MRVSAALVVVGVLLPGVAIVMGGEPVSSTSLAGIATSQTQPAEDRSFAAGDFRLTLRLAAGGVKLQGLFDAAAGRELLAPDSPSLFVIAVRRGGDGPEALLKAGAGWRRVTVDTADRGFIVRWDGPQDERYAGIRVIARASADAGGHAWRWSLQVENANAEWGVWRVVFPQVTVARPGERSNVLFPQGPGVLKGDAWDRKFRWRGTYPGGWCSMQFMAVYGDGPKPTGLYFGLHDPVGSTKDVGLESEPTAHGVRLYFDVPAPDMGKPGNGFSLPGEVVWQLFRGDWFDAATIYRAWVRREAKWWPRLGAEGRADTSPWMRELCAWAQTGGAPSECAPGVKRFAEFLGVPVGFHWYNWHQIPFDNDYPHYFPTKPGFAEGVHELQNANVFVMPYINGRLWDTHDRGAEEFEFTKAALPWATKDPAGKPITEAYNSKESDGSKVELAVMCPATPFWQGTVRDIVLRLMNETGTKGVYIDQVAAAAPVLCMDKSHGHPLGGGSWWNEGYWRMLDAIRAAMPKDRILTTECNGEPFVRWFDGYLTWHWQFDGQVPAFPAIYGGAVQMFGRAYRAGPTKDLALRMKAGQQLVFGEQIGWLSPSVVDEKANGDSLRRMVRLRHRLRRYFYAGEMARPPKLLGQVPTVTADWQWSGVWNVTTDAVLTGAWTLPAEKRMVLLFVNVSDQPVTATPAFNPEGYGITAGKLDATAITDADETMEGKPLPDGLPHEARFPARRATAWELRW
jgi:hypothetical protein